jgi:transposase
VFEAFFAMTKGIHALVDAEGRPVRLALTAGQAGDAPAAKRLLSLVARGATLIADRPTRPTPSAPRSPSGGAGANIPPRVIRKDGLAFSGRVYKQRDLIERFFNRIKHFRGLATRYDHSPDNFLAALKLAAIRFWPAAK